MQSHDFVEGVSGWRMGKDKFELYGGQYPVILGKLDEPVPKPVYMQPTPFIVVDGVVYLSEAEVERGAKIASMWGVKVELRNGRYIASGIGIGIGIESPPLKESTEIADQVRDVIRAELQAGGLLHRSR